MNAKQEEIDTFLMFWCCIMLYCFIFFLIVSCQVLILNFVSFTGNYFVSRLQQLHAVILQ